MPTQKFQEAWEHSDYGRILGQALAAAGIYHGAKKLGSLDINTERAGEGGIGGGESVPPGGRGGSDWLPFEDLPQDRPPVARPPEPTRQMDLFRDINEPQQQGLPLGPYRNPRGRFANTGPSRPATVRPFVDTPMQQTLDLGPDGEPWSARPLDIPRTETPTAPPVETPVVETPPTTETPRPSVPGAIPEGAMRHEEGADFGPIPLKELTKELVVNLQKDGYYMEDPVNGTVIFKKAKGIGELIKGQKGSLDAEGMWKLLKQLLGRDPTDEEITFARQVKMGEQTEPKTPPPVSEERFGPGYTPDNVTHTPEGTTSIFDWAPPPYKGTEEAIFQKRPDLRGKTPLELWDMWNSANEHGSNEIGDLFDLHPEWIEGVRAQLDARHNPQFGTPNAEGQLPNPPGMSVDDIHADLAKQPFMSHPPASGMGDFINRIKNHLAQGFNENEFGAILDEARSRIINEENPDIVRRNYEELQAASDAAKTPDELEFIGHLLDDAIYQHGRIIGQNPSVSFPNDPNGPNGVPFDPIRERQVFIEQRYQTEGRAIDKYRLPDGTVIPVDATATKGVQRTPFQLRDGSMVEMEYVGPLEPNDVIDPNTGKVIQINYPEGPSSANDEGIPPDEPRRPFPTEEEQLENQIPWEGPDPTAGSDTWGLDVGGIRQQNVLGQNESRGFATEREMTLGPTASGPRGIADIRIDRPVPPQMGQQELPLGPHTEMIPRELPEDIGIGHDYSEPSARPEVVEPEQRNLPVVDDAIIKDYLDKEDVITPEMRDLKTGQVPRRRWSKELNKFIGDETGAINLESISRTKIAEAIRNAFQRGPNDEPSTFEEMVATPTNLTTTGDLSAPLRQGLPQIFTKEWRQAVVPMLRAFGNPEYSRQVNAELMNLPAFQRFRDTKTGKIIPSLADKAGMKPIIGSDVTRSEMDIASSWAETGKPLDLISTKLGDAYRTTAGRYFKASNRAYATFLNHIRMNSLQNLVDQARATSLEALETGSARPGLLRQNFTPESAAELNPYTNTVRAKEIADYVNTVTGRGPLKTHIIPVEGTEINVEAAANILRWGMFAPRLVASRMRMLNPNTYAMATPFVRKQYLKSALGLAAAWGGVAMLGKAANQAGIADVQVSFDPNSADFMKLRFGNTRLDPGGGFQQFLVAYSRMITGHETSSNTQKDFELGVGYRPFTRGSALQQFGSNKLNPFAKFGYDLLFATERQPVHMLDRTAQMFVPLVHQDLLELLKSDPYLLPLMIPVAGGMGLQTYDKGESIHKIVPDEYDWLFKGGGADIFDSTSPQ
jgi:hypothetical protein